MTQAEFAEIESRFDRLPLDAQLGLIERLVQRLRQRRMPDDWANDLIAMAGDPDIRNELHCMDDR